MFGLIQDQPLLISSLIVHADRHHGATEMVSRVAAGSGGGALHRYTIRDAHRRARQLANALERLGIAQGDRVATLAWNSHRHLEFYYAVSGMGAVCHTINPRLFHEQIVYIINHAEDKAVFYDLVSPRVVEKLRPLCPTVEHWVAMDDRAAMAATASRCTRCYEELIAGESDDFAWPVFDERLASSLCYTSGTTGYLSKVRSISIVPPVLHSRRHGAARLPQSLGARRHLSGRRRCSTSTPGACPIRRCWSARSRCFLARRSRQEPLRAVRGEQVTMSAGVPTVWFGLLNFMAEQQLRFSSLQRCSWSAAPPCPPSMIERFENDYGVEVVHAWGMTELSPIGTFAQLKAKHRNADAAIAARRKTTQGRVIPGIDLKIVDGAGEELPWDGVSAGDLDGARSWVTTGYYKAADASSLRDGWFPTGDVATIDADGDHLSPTARRT